MSETHTANEHAENAGDGKPKPKIHRVCIGCNNMFEVTLDNYEAKHCPVCHKG
jgi:rRNA maturation endonuclease Nob1